jgi:subtilisin family serine protease
MWTLLRLGRFAAMVSGFLLLLQAGGLAVVPAKAARRPGTVLYRLKATLTVDQHRALHTVRDEFGLKTVRGYVKGRVLRAVETGADDEEAICRRLMATGAVEFAEPDYLIPPAVIPNDPNYPVSWHHAKMRSPWAWEVSTGSPAVIAAVLDTGVQTTHPDLAGRIDLAHGINVVDWTTNFEDQNGHGTMCAGALAAAGNNALGVTGMAWNVTILPVRISNQADGSAYTSDMIDGVIYAADHGARVVSLSYSPGNSISLEDAATYLRSRGGLLFVAAGNQGAEQTWYDLPSRISVGATDQNDLKTSFSSWGPFVDLVAPGNAVWTTKIGSSYGTATGTSMATPLAAGVAALIFAADPARTPTQVENLIFATCVDLGDPGEDDFYGCGRIDAAAALAALYPARHLPPMAVADGQRDVTVTGSYRAAAVSLDGTGSRDLNGALVHYVWREGTVPLASGPTATVTLAVGTHQIELVVTDDDGLTAADTLTVTVWPKPTATWQVAASGDDSYASAGSGAYWQSGTMYFPYTTDERRSFIRWPITVPAGCTVVAARMRVQSNGSATNGQESLARLHLLDFDSCPSFAGVNPYAWPVTGAQADWLLPLLWTAGQWYASGDIAAVVQAHVDRPGYAAGAYLGLRCSPVSGTFRQAYQYDFSPASAATLAVTWWPGPAGSGGTVTEWTVAADHGPAGEVTMPAAEGYVEPRANGLQRLRLHFSAALDLVTVSPTSVAVLGQTSGDQSGSVGSVTLASGNTEMIVQFSVPLPDGDRYTLMLSDSLRFTDGGAVLDGGVRHLATLAGDVDGSGRVTVADLLAVRRLAGQSPSGDRARADVTASGVISGDDLLAVRRSMGRSLP